MQLPSEINYKQFFLQEIDAIITKIFRGRDETSESHNRVSTEIDEAIG